MNEPRWLRALTRIVLGCSFLFSDHGNGSPGELMGFLDFATKNGFLWYRHVLASLVVPHAEIFGRLIIVGEITIGLALIVGLAARLAAAGAIFLLVNYECAKGSPPWIPGIDQAEIMLALIVFAWAAGRAYGLDALLWRRFRDIPIW